MNHDEDDEYDNTLGTYVCETTTGCLCNDDEDDEFSCECCQGDNGRCASCDARMVTVETFERANNDGQVVSRVH